MSDALLRWAAGRAARRDVFLASVLLPFAWAEQLDDEALAARLGCPVQDLPKLLLCRRPRTDPAGFWEDVQRIAAAHAISPDRLAEVVRLAESVLALQRGSARGARGWLAAARDRPPEPNDTDEP